jgi:hypothetical protein
MRRFQVAKNNDEWLVQMHVFPEQGEKGLEYEHDYPYTVEYNPADGKRRTVKMSAEEITEVRAFNGLPSEQILDEDGEEVSND